MKASINSRTFTLTVPCFTVSRNCCVGRAYFFCSGIKYIIFEDLKEKAELKGNLKETPANVL